MCVNIFYDLAEVPGGGAMAAVAAIRIGSHLDADAIFYIYILLSITRRVFFLLLLPLQTRREINWFNCECVYILERAAQQSSHAGCSTFLFIYFNAVVL